MSATTENISNHENARHFPTSRGGFAALSGPRPAAPDAGQVGPTRINRQLHGVPIRRAASKAMVPAPR